MQPNTPYVLTNVKSGTAMEVSLLDNSVKGNPFTGQPNQQWKFVPLGNDFYAIESMQLSRSGQPLYVSLTKSGACATAAVAAAMTPMGWKITEVDEGVRMTWSQTNLTIDLYCGKSDANTPITLWHRNMIEKCQVWGYTPCKLDNVSQPAKADTVVTSGPYLLQNVDNDTVMDVNSGDYRAIKCYRAHREQNQQWEYVMNGNEGCAIRSVVRKPGSSEPLYLTVEGPIGQGARVVASPYPVTWDIKCTHSAKQAVCFFWPGTQFTIARGEGNDAIGFKVELAVWHPGVKRSQWCPILVDK
ncbi:hypothetical protein C8Q76DRAFT_175394 [Earliella scabrosa]|nr:hypothetical protein C8Q76DRAFT_175394 [Earliella scabrosa]